MSLATAIRHGWMRWKGPLPAGLIPQVPAADHIPRLLHQVFFTRPRGPPPLAIRQNIARLRQLNPDWSYRLYDEEAMVAFIGQHYGPRLLDYFARIDPRYGAARADLFRYLLLYRLGGVYLDVKSSMHRPLSECIRPDDRYLLSYWRNRPGEEFPGWGLYPELAGSPRGEFQQWHIVAAAGHPFLRAVIERVLANIAHYNPVLDGTGWSGVLRSTGPIAYTLAILPHLSAQPHRLVDSLRDLGFQYSIYPRAIQHQRMFSSHYAQRTEPIVRLGRIDAALCSLLGALRAARLGLRARARWRPAGKAR